MNKIIANISLGLLLSCSTTSFSMDNDNPEKSMDNSEEIKKIYIPERQLFKFYPFHNKDKPINPKEKESKEASLENSKIINRDCSLSFIQDKGDQLYIVTTDNRQVPIHGSIPLNTLHSLRFCKLGGLKALDNEGNQYIVEKTDIDWNTLGSVQKTVTVSPKFIEHVDDEKTKIYNNASIYFNYVEAPALEIRYLRGNEKIIKEFDNNTLPFTQEKLEQLKSYSSKEQPCSVHIFDTTTNKTTIFNIKELAGDILLYSEGIKKTDSSDTPTQEEKKIEEKELDPKPKLQTPKEASSPAPEKNNPQSSSLSWRVLVTHPLTLTGIGAMVLLLIAHYSDYFSNNLNIMQMLNKLLSTKNKGFYE